MAGNRKIRYAVVGLGHITQAAVLPAFKNAKKNSELAALVSGDPKKLSHLGKKYKIDKNRRYSYDDYDACLRSGDVEAVYIALPNSMHCEYSIRAAQAGVHVLCEKPMAVTESECQAMIEAAATHNVRLMVAYRLHFEKANLEAVKLVTRGRIGNPRIFSSIFTMQVKEGDIRLQRALGGGTLYDLGVYCINAARYLFRAEPQEVFAWSANNGEKRFAEVDEMTSAVLRFPGEQLAVFTTSFGAEDTSMFEVTGAKGSLRLDPAYNYSMALKMELTVGGKTKRRQFPKSDQFAPELLYFSDCVLMGKEPEPSGWDGLADVRVVQALYESASTGMPVKAFDTSLPKDRPGPEQEIRRPPMEKPEEVHAESPHQNR